MSDLQQRNRNALLAQARSSDDYSPLVNAIPYARFLGIEVQLQGDQRLYRLPVQDGLIGNAALPALHGGAIAAFVESAALIEVLAVQGEQSKLPKSVDFSIDYVSSAELVDSWAQCHVVRQGRQVVLVQITAWQKSPNNPIVTARVHFLLDNAETVSA